MKSLYEILEVEPDATQETIREQYLFLIQAWHPDKFPNNSQKAKAEAKTKDINAAYEVLRNSVKRAEYDRSIRSSSSTQNQSVRSRQDARSAGRRAGVQNRHREEKLRKEQTNGKRLTGVKVFIDGQECVLNVGELVKATVQYIDGETKEELGFDTLRTHAAVRAAASRCLKSGVEIHVRQLAL